MRAREKTCQRPLLTIQLEIMKGYPRTAKKTFTKPTQVGETAMKRLKYFYSLHQVIFSSRVEYYWKDRHYVILSVQQSVRPKKMRQVHYFAPYSTLLFCCGTISPLPPHPAYQTTVFSPKNATICALKKILYLQFSLQKPPPFSNLVYSPSPLRMHQ